MNDEQARQLDRVDKKIGEIHNYVRHTMQTLIVWYTFFVTVNSASMGLLAKDIDFTKTNKGLLYLIGGIFVSQNVLGILAFRWVKKKLNQSSDDISQYETVAAILTGQTCLRDISMPADLYSKVISMMMLTLLIIIAAWCTFPFLL